MRTVLADAKIKLKIMTAHDGLRHMVEDHGSDSAEAVEAREMLRNAVRHGFSVGLTDRDIRRITRPDSDEDAQRDLEEALVEQRIVEGPVLTQEEVAAREKPKPVRRGRPRKQIEAQENNQLGTA